MLREVREERNRLKDDWFATQRPREIRIDEAATLAQERVGDAAYSIESIRREVSALREWISNQIKDD